MEGLIKLRTVGEKRTKKSDRVGRSFTYAKKSSKKKRTEREEGGD